MADSHGGHEENSDRKATPPASPGNGAEGDSYAPSAPRLDQLWHREEDLDEALRLLVKERAKVRHRDLVRWQLGYRGDGDHAREVNRQIADDHTDHPNFAQESQNIAAAAAVLVALPGPQNRRSAVNATSSVSS